MSGTFSGGAKAKLERAPVGGMCCARAELSAILYSTATLSMLDDDSITLTVENRRPYAARRAEALVRALFADSPPHCDSGDLHARWAGEGALKIASSCGLLSDQGWFALTDVERPSASRKKCCAKAFLRGSFISAGSVTDPQKEYHMELAAADERLRDIWLELMTDLGLTPRMAIRKGFFVIYLKDAERIAKFLAHIGAGAARCGYEDARIIKGLRNDANRAANCDSANTDKAVDAAQRQIEAIKYIARNHGIGRLPEVLEDTARKRLAYPDLPLAELGRSLRPPVGKSGANHRLKRLEEIAELVKDSVEKNKQPK